MYRQRRAVERIVTMEVMRLERRLAIQRGDIVHAPFAVGLPGSGDHFAGRPAPRPN